LLAIAAVSFVFIYQDRFFYFPLHYSVAEVWAVKSIGVRQLNFRTSQGNQAAFFWRNRDSETAPQNVWILFGGNASVALGWIDLIRDFSALDTGFLLIDYPGYGICEGKPDPESILENSEGAVRALEEQMHWHLGPETLGVLGHSLGGAAALQFAARHAVHKIVLISPFTTMDDMVRGQIHISLGPLLRHKFDNVRTLKSILSRNQNPQITIFHGESDDLIPVKMGRALAQLEPGRIKFVEVRGAHHNDVIEPALSQGLQAPLPARR